MALEEVPRVSEGCVLLLNGAQVKRVHTASGLLRTQHFWPTCLIAVFFFLKLHFIFNSVCACVSVHVSAGACRGQHPQIPWSESPGSGAGN